MNDWIEYNHPTLGWEDGVCPVSGMPPRSIEILKDDYTVSISSLWSEEYSWYHKKPPNVKDSFAIKAYRKRTEEEIKKNARFKNYLET